VKNKILTEKQQAFVEKNWKNMRETEIFEKICELGPRPHRKDFGMYLKDMAAKAENKVFNSNMSEEELGAVAGGFCGNPVDACFDPATYKVDHCTELFFRHIYEGSFPNCAATVENGSWCGSNDACYNNEVCYLDMKDCSKAWE